MHDGHPGLLVVGAGFGRTGTTSMKQALDHLGLGPTHHMFEAFDDPDSFDVWASALRGDPWDPGAVLSGYRSTVDFPSSAVWEQLWRANPHSTVLLTTRPAEDWWRSFDATIGPALRDGATGSGPHAAMFAELHRVVFDGRSAERDAAIAAYLAHQEHVLATVPASQLLVHHVGDGWGPLCERFALDVPDLPFPSSNSTEAFRAGRGRPQHGDLRPADGDLRPADGDLRP